MGGKVGYLKLAQFKSYGLFLSFSASMLLLLFPCSPRTSTYAPPSHACCRASCHRTHFKKVYEDLIISKKYRSLHLFQSSPLDKKSFQKMKKIPFPYFGFLSFINFLPLQSQPFWFVEVGPTRSFGLDLIISLYDLLKGGFEKWHESIFVILKTFFLIEYLIERNMENFYTLLKY